MVLTNAEITILRVLTNNQGFELRQENLPRRVSPRIAIELSKKGYIKSISIPRHSDGSVCKYEITDKGIQYMKDELGFDPLRPSLVAK